MPIKNKLKRLTYMRNYYKTHREKLLKWAKKYRGLMKKFFGKTTNRKVVGGCPMVNRAGMVKEVFFTKGDAKELNKGVMKGSVVKL